MTVEDIKLNDPGGYIVLDFKNTYIPERQDIQDKLYIKGIYNFVKNCNKMIICTNYYFTTNSSDTETFGHYYNVPMSKLYQETFQTSNGKKIREYLYLISNKVGGTSSRGISFRIYQDDSITLN